MSSVESEIGEIILTLDSSIRALNHHLDTYSILPTFSLDDKLNQNRLVNIYGYLTTAESRSYIERSDVLTNIYEFLHFDALTGLNGEQFSALVDSLRRLRDLLDPDPIYSIHRAQERLTP
ncbi:MAG: hypothetical protein KBD64_06035 [Gammaproteobacteria bacterium]|nr:hypothetical protein [Gammaproteobacteria bacterium]